VTKFVMIQLIDIAKSKGVREIIRSERREDLTKSQGVSVELIW
jgi:hypothetical protein